MPVEQELDIKPIIGVDRLYFLRQPFISFPRALENFARKYRPTWADISVSEESGNICAVIRYNADGKLQPMSIKQFRRAYSAFFRDVPLWLSQLNVAHIRQTVVSESDGCLSLTIIYRERLEDEGGVPVEKTEEVPVTTMPPGWENVPNANPDPVAV